ncbi:MAG: ankyrin repeat domain-containing protein [Sphingomonadaceae bacterium]
MASKAFPAAGLAAAAALALAAPHAAPAQIRASEGYEFIQAVKKRDGTTVTGMVTTPGVAVINHRDRSGQGALHYVAAERDLTWLRFLLHHGANPDLADDDGDTALILATRLGWVEGAEALIAHEADVDRANDRGETPLIVAVLHRSLPLARLLLKQGADPDKSDSVAGYSARDYAQRDRRAAAILRLIEQDASE